MVSYRLLKALLGCLLGAVIGIIFSTGFGLLASVFQGGPSVTAGISDSVSFFAFAFALAGVLLAEEK